MKTALITGQHHQETSMSSVPFIDPYEYKRITDMARRVVAAEGAGEVPRTADGHQIVVLTQDRWWTTSCYNVTRYDVARARSRLKGLP